MKYIRFIHLCWRAYNGDYRAALEVFKILKARAGVAVVKIGEIHAIVPPRGEVVIERIEGP